MPEPLPPPHPQTVAVHPGKRQVAVHRRKPDHDQVMKSRRHEPLHLAKHHLNPHEPPQSSSETSNPLPPGVDPLTPVSTP